MRPSVLVFSGARSAPPLRYPSLTNLAGSGRRLFPDGLDLKRLTLTKTTRSATGCVFLGYRRP